MTSNLTRLWLALFVAVVFVGGVGTGALVNNWLSRSAEPAVDGRRFGPRGGGRESGRGPAPERLVGRLADQLDLTDEQRAQLDVLLEEQRDQMRSFNDDVRGRFRSAQQEIRDAIEEILTPEQRERFNELTIERGRSRRDFRRGRGRRGGL